MGIRFRRGGTSPLLPGEEVLRTAGGFRAVSGACAPNYRIYRDIRHVSQLALIITDRRCLVVTSLFRDWCVQEIDMWYPGRNPADKTDMIRSVSAENGLFGPCLEIRSRDTRRPWHWPLLIWSPTMTLRFFFPEPAPLANLIRKAMEGGRQDHG